ETDIEEAIAGLGREPGSGLIAMTDSFMTVHRKAVIELSIQNKLPLMYYVSVAPREGGLISYGIDLADLFGRSASYVDRILRGAKPAELPVQLPTKFEMTINLRTARALGGDYAKLDAEAARLVSASADVIVAQGTPGLVAARK